MDNYYLAIDMGASGGRHILGHLEGGKIIIEEIHRFENGMLLKDGELCWDTEMLFREIISGLKKCKETGKIPVSVGIDTWGVDFVLLDENGKILGNTVGYRDSRTKGMDEKVFSFIQEKDLYERTGIQKQDFNTIYQLMSVKEMHPEYLEKAFSMLMIPDYFHYLLAGVMKTEYTNATTTQLVSPETKDWDRDLIELLGYPQKIFKEIITPGTVIGNLKKTIQDEIGYNCRVVIPATHDTASAVIAVPSDDPDILYISSGTWSLLGTERADADCKTESREHNFTNEGGFNYKFRYLKNIMGLWMIQSVKKEFKRPYTFSEIGEMASGEVIESIVDCSSSVFFAPDSMINEIKRFCNETNQREPVSDAEIAAVIYNSLAVCYAKAVKDIEKMTNCTYRQINVVGGGANADYLNRLTAKYTGKKVVAGPTEATAIGNLAVQMICDEKLAGINEVRNLIFDSFEIKKAIFSMPD